MLFAATPEVRHAAMVEFIRHWAGALRRVSPGRRAPLPVQKPMVSRFVIAGICAWLLLQPLTGKGQRQQANISGPSVPAAAAFAASADATVTPHVRSDIKFGS
jgi:hypothetical protein